MQWTEPHFAAPSRNLVPERPTATDVAVLAARRLQIQIAAIAKPGRVLALRRAQVHDLPRREPVDDPFHDLSLASGDHGPTRV